MFESFGTAGLQQFRELEFLGGGAANGEGERFGDQDAS